MKIGLLFFYLIMPFQAFGWSYKFVPINKYNGLDLYEISQELKKNSFFEMDLRREGRLRGLLFDQLFLNSKNPAEFAVVVFDLIGNGPVFSDSDPRTVCHGETGDGRNFAIYFSSKKLSRNLLFCRPKQIAGTSIKSLLLASLTKPAMADICDPVLAINKNIVQARAAAFNGAEWIIQKMGTCLLSAMQGSVGAVQRYSDTLNLLANPKLLWEEVSNQAKALKNFVTNISSVAQSMIQNFSNLDGELVLAALCQTGGQVLVDSLVLGGGLGIALKLGVALEKLAARLNDMRTVFAKLSVLKKSGRMDLANGVLSCAR